jgi:hypothetical protein
VEGVAAPFPDDPDALLTPLDRTSHDLARAAARAGRLYEAKRLLGRLASSYPGHEVLVAQYNAVGAAIDQAQAVARASLEAATLRRPAAPPATYTLVRPAPSTGAPLPTLVKRSQTKNGITDDEAWFTKNAVHTPEYFVPPPGDLLFAPGTISTSIAADLASRFVFVDYERSRRFLEATLPAEVPLAYGTLPLTHAIDSKPYTLAIYDARVLAVFDASMRAVGLFDFEEYEHPPANREGKAVVGRATLTTPEGSAHADVTVATNTILLDLLFALAADGVLYVEHRANMYAREAKGQTAYITALDLATGELLWRSAPLVANAQTFIVAGGGLVCGYGFTAEPRFLFVLDRATGVKKQTLSTSTSPEYIVPKGGALYVRGYDSDFVFDVR